MKSEHCCKIRENHKNNSKNKKVENIFLYSNQGKSKREIHKAGSGCPIHAMRYNESWDLLRRAMYLSAIFAHRSIITKVILNPGRSLKSRQSESALAQVPITPNFEGTQPFTSLSMSLPCLILNSTKVVKQESRSRRKMKKDRKTLIIPHSQGQSR